jgi:NitT/TauT family transport system permease protein
VLITALVFGNRWYGPLIAIILTTFALVSVNVAEGIGSLPKDTIDMARAFKVGVVDRNRHIVIPHLAPYLFTGLRFAFSIGWKVTVLTEIFTASSGIGFELRIAQILFRQDEVLTWILLFFVFALFLEKVVLQAIEDKFFRWRKEIAST